MAKDKKGFVLYADLLHTIEHLTDDQTGKLFRHILKYVNDLNPETDDQLIKIVFEPIKQQLKRDLKKYENRAERSRENGKKGGRPKKPTETQKTQQVNLKPRKPDKDKDNVKDNVKDINKEKNKNKKERFVNIDENGKVIS